MGRTPWLPNVAVGTVGSAPGTSPLYSEGAGTYASGPLQLQPSLIMGLQSWPGMECSRRLRSHGATRPHLPPPGTHACTQLSVPQWDGLWNIPAFTPWGLYETGLTPTQKGSHPWPGICPFGPLLGSIFLLL